ncbi:MAG: rod shape-determining protein [Alphaproteobacteria bacterium]|nr:rod shape-determining protein [Alphaproteobacteria bacterium]MBL0718005.1 rod shape-determining protein [Alphaproteobacteria bacterium]
MFNSLRNAFCRDLAIDLGTANTLVYSKGEGIVLSEPSVVAIVEDKYKQKVLAIGNEAKTMLGRTPGNIKAIQPLRDGVIADFRVAEDMIKHFMLKARNKSLFSPLVVICVPASATPVERRAIQEATELAGGRKVLIVEEPMAAAVGAGLPVQDPRGSMVVDIGGGTSDIAIISLGGIVHSKSIRVGGHFLDNSIIEYIKKKYNILIGSMTAEDIKMKIGGAKPPPAGKKSLSQFIKGRDLSSGIPCEIKITEADIVSALKDGVNQIVSGVKDVLEKTPPELASDVFERGIVVTGGGALLRNLDVVLTQATGVPVFVADDPLSCVIRGSGIILENIKNYESWLTQMY